VKLRLLIAAMSVAAAVPACSPDLPEPASTGAKLYEDRCTGCHRLYHPGSMKADMWRTQVERMQGEMARRGVRPLSRAEMDVLLDYLRRNAG